MNRQNIEGAAHVAEAVISQQQKGRSDNSAVRIFPIVTRVESAELQKLRLARKYIAAKFSGCLRHLPNEQLARYWESVEIPHIPFYAYEEVLCTFADSQGEPTSMLAVIERITAFLTDGLVAHLPLISDSQRARVLSAFSRLAPVASPGVSCFTSYSSKDEVFVKKLYADLSNAGIKCWFAPHDLPIGPKIRVGIDEAIRTHDKVIIILSVNSIASAWVEKEVETAFEQEAATRSTVLIPLEGV